MIINLFKKFHKLIILFLVIPMLFSCDGSGCIDSDDFGEYSSFNFDVNSNYLESLCAYNSNKTPDDISQGELFKKYFTQNCTSGSDMEKRNCAVTQSINCKFFPLENTALILPNFPSDRKLSEPNWTSTQGQMGIVLEEESKISIVATGEINLGGSSNSVNAVAITNDNGSIPRQVIGTTSSASSQMHSASMTNKLKYFKDDNIYIKFWGTFSDGTTTDYLNNASGFANYGDSNISEVDSNFYLNYGDPAFANGANQIFAYTIPFPNSSGGYPLDKIPIFINPLSWRCKIEELSRTTGTNYPSDLDCIFDENNLNDYYELEGIRNEDIASENIPKYNKTFTNLFKVSNSDFKESTRFYKNSGFVRYKNDGFKGANDTSFIDTDPNYRQIENILFIHNNWVSIPPPMVNEDYVIRFEAHSSCSRDFVYTMDSTETQISIGSVPIEISKDRFQYLKVKYTANTNFPENCYFRVYFYDYKYINILNSGYLNFGYVNKFKEETAPDSSGQVTFNFAFPTITNNCKLYYELINKDDTSDYNNSPETATKTRASPASLGKSTYTFNELHQQVFVRKGQRIKIHPASWDGTWTATSGDISRKTYEFNCGVGLYTHLIPRPAVFCSKLKLKERINVNLDRDNSNNCNDYYSSNFQSVTGCKEDLSICSNILTYNNSGVATGINNKFCPSKCLDLEFLEANCRPTYNPADGGYAPVGSCGLTINPAVCSEVCSSSDCKSFEFFATESPYKAEMDQTAFRNYVPSPNIATYFNRDNCNRCLDYIKAEVIRNKFTDSTELTQCYDLEEYSGSMTALNNAITTANISDSTIKYVGSSIDPIKVLSDKKLKKISTFNGQYGNLYPLIYNKINVNGFNQFKTAKSSFMSTSGYLKFILLRGNYADNFDFNSTSTNNFVSSNLRFSTEEIKTKSNGNGMSVNLCQENSSSDFFCESSSTENQIIDTFSDKKHIVIATHEAMSINNNYEFINGYLTRITPISTNMSNPINHSLMECSNAPMIGENFLCFKNPQNTSAPRDYSFNKRYKLSFKIIDSSQSGNCKTKTSDINQFETCVPVSASDTSCNRVTMANPNYDKTDPANSGYCDRITSIPTLANVCSKKYYCVEKYADNSGKYNVTVYVQKKSMESVSRFINSIISPVLSQVDGFYYEKDSDYYQSGDVLAEIQTARFEFDRFSSVVDGATVNNTKFLKDNVYLSRSRVPVTIKQKIDDFKVYDKNIVGALHLKSQNRSLNIDLSRSVPNSFNINYIISYIGIVGYGKDDKTIARTPDQDVSMDTNCFYVSRDLVQYVQDACLFRTKCSLLIDQNRFLMIQQSPSASLCENNELQLSIIYSIPTKKLSQANYVKEYYKKLSNTPAYRNILILSIVLMFTFYGFGYLIGVSELKQSEIIDRLIKISIIYLFCDPVFGWAWFERFFVDGFKGGADFITFTIASLFDDSQAIISAINSENFTDKSPLFISADKVIGLIFTNEVIHKKIGALLFYKLYGVVYLYIIYLSIFNYIYAISNAVLLYLTAQVFTSILFMVAPIFFIFILFKQTKTFFDNWINSLIGFALQQIFLIFTLSLFNVFIYNLIKTTLSYSVCWDTIWRITSQAGSLSLFSYWTVSDAPNFLNQTNNFKFNGDFNKSTPNLPSILAFWSMTLIMKSFINSITDLAALLSGGIAASSLGDGIRGGMNKLAQNLSGGLNKLYEKSGLKSLTDRADKELFGSGALAKQERKQQREQQRKDAELRKKMESAAKKAENDFKKKNLLAGDKALSGKELENKLKEVRKGAMLKKAHSKGHGADSDYVKNLMKSTNTFDGKGNLNMPKTDNIFNAMRIIGGNMIKDSGGFSKLAGGAASKIAGAAKSAASGVASAMKDPRKTLGNMASGAKSAMSSAVSAASNPRDTLSKAGASIASGAKSASESMKNFKESLKSNNLEKSAEKVDTTVSEKDVKSAIKEASPEQRESLVKDIKDGKVDVKSDNPNQDKKGSNVQDRLEAYANKQNQKDRE